MATHGLSLEQRKGRLKQLLHIDPVEHLHQVREE